MVRLQEEQQKRIMPKFDDSQNIKSDKIIAQYIRELTQNIKTAEENIKAITFIELKNNNEAPGNNHIITKLHLLITYSLLFTL